MYIDSVALDITKSPQEVLIQKINAVNGLQLNFDDFVFETPEAFVNPLYPESNTRVKVVPKATSQYYNSFTIYYKRMQINTILNNPLVAVSRDGAENLSEVIDQINTKYNIHLTADDYYDSPFPPIDPGDPGAEFPVMFTCKTESLLFIGSYQMTINGVAQNPPNSNMETADVYILLSQTYKTNQKSNIVCRTSTGDFINNFDFLRNCSNVSMVDVTNFTHLKNLGILLFGDFDLDIDFDGSGAQSVQSNCLLMSTSGKIVGDLNNKFGASNNSGLIHVKDNQKKYHYVIDTYSNLGAATSHLYRFDTNGNLDLGFDIATSYEVGYARVDAQGRIYVVSKMQSITEDHDNDPGTADVLVPQYWIERFLEDGTLDPVFARMKITAENLNTPMYVANIDPIEGDINTTGSGVYIGFVPNSLLSTSDPSLMVNGTPMVPASVTEEYAHLPMLKVLNTGAIDPAFKYIQPGFSTDAIYSYDSMKKPKTGDNFVTAVGNDVVMLSYRRNPITLYTFKIPMLFDSTGTYKPLSGAGYLDGLRFTDASSIESIYANTTLMFGQCDMEISPGVYEPRSIVASYDKDSRLQAVVYQTVTDVDGTPTVKQLLLLDGH